MIMGVDEGTAEADACQIEHNVTPKTMRKLTKFVEFVESDPDRHKWLGDFKEFKNSD